MVDNKLKMELLVVAGHLTWRCTLPESLATRTIRDTVNLIVSRDHSKDALQVIVAILADYIDKSKS